MIEDDKNTFGPEEAIPNAGNVDFDDILDSAVNPGLFHSDTNPLYWNAMVTEDGADGTTAQLILYHSDDKGAWEALLTTVEHAIGVIKKGFVMISVPIPVEHQRYLKANLIGAGAFSAGKVKTGLYLTPAKSTS